ncbi:MAG TPA: LLM class flavin-dependent oxidoreductase [Labilithrix sp.]|nr:LLM class flavin-dependent oxidoreductase [Labilithrix sp.]
MRFDVFHSLGRLDDVEPKVSDREVFADYFDQLRAAEELGFGTMWVAESHFSTEVQKNNPFGVVPHFKGEIGLNTDSLQLAQVTLARTKRIDFGTAILNIVGANGGPVGAADRVRALAFLNAVSEAPRGLHIGIAAGRFPYVNRPYGIAPRCETEKRLWPQYQRLIFLEALEIFLRLSHSETLGSDAVTKRTIGRELFDSDDLHAQARETAGVSANEEIPYRPRWSFDPLRLVPELPAADWRSFMRFVLGSSEPTAMDVAFEYDDIDIFNLSFTPPAKIAAVHSDMQARCSRKGRIWNRSRMPRTVLIAIDPDPAVAERRIDAALDTYLRGTSGTIQVPVKESLRARAVVGDASSVRAQLEKGSAHDFHPDDRLMLWFEFNQPDGREVVRQMRYFAERVMPHFVD